MGQTQKSQVYSEQFSHMQHLTMTRCAGQTGELHPSQIDLVLLLHFEQCWTLPSFWRVCCCWFSRNPSNMAAFFTAWGSLVFLACRIRACFCTSCWQRSLRKFFRFKLGLSFFISKNALNAPTSNILYKMMRGQRTVLRRHVYSLTF